MANQRGPGHWRYMSEPGQVRFICPNQGAKRLCEGAAAPFKAAQPQGVAGMTTE